MAVLNQQMQQPVEQGQIRSGSNLHEQVGLLGGCRSPGVHNNQLGAVLHPVHHPQEQNGMTVGHIGADNEE
ncbi:hypothetical protein D3C76_1588930 [compost metagenome]